MESSSKQSTVLTTCIIGSVALHLSAFMGSGIYVTYFKEKPSKITIEEVIEKKKEQKAAVEEAVAELRVSFPELPTEVFEQMKQQVEEKTSVDSKLEIKQELLAKVEEQKEIEESETQVVIPKDSFERTTAAQESEKVAENTRLYGERNTIAKSDTKATQNAPDRVAVSGDKPRTAFEKDIIKSQFRDGKLADEGGGSKTPLAGNPEAKELSKLIDEDFQKVVEKLSSPEAEKSTVAKQADPVEQPANGKDDQTQKSVAAHKVDQSKVLDFGKKIARNSASIDQREKEARAKNPDQVNPNVAKITQQKVADQLKSSKGQRVKQIQDPFAKSSGMSSKIRKNRMAGSLSTRGSVASRNVKRTPLGQYENAILRSIEKQWQKKIAENPHFYQPGSFSAIFYVNEKGQMLNCRFEDAPQRMSMLKGFTYQAMKDATLPTMPRAVREIMQGNPSEMRIHFTF